MGNLMFAGHDEIALIGTKDPEIAAKLEAIGDTEDSVRHLIRDYLWSEGFGIRVGLPSFPEKRASEFFSVCDILKRKRAQEIRSILGDPDRSMGTNENREYLLKKFGLWSGE